MSEADRVLRPKKARNRRWQDSYWWPIALALVSAGFVVLAVFQYQSAARTRNWPTVNAEVIEVHARQDGVQTDYDTTIRYTIDGVTYEFRSEFGAVGVGSTVSVQYDPLDPSRAVKRQDRSGMYSTMVTWIILAAGTAGGAVWGFIGGRRKRSGHPDGKPTGDPHASG
jgi:hypothetical protein